MFNTGKFFGRTVVITGASRGIGKEIALKLAKDGANVVIAAKTTTAHPKLPGTIYTAAEEVEKQALTEDWRLCPKVAYPLDELDALRAAHTLHLFCDNLDYRFCY
ncbi:hypothetical protein OESDEN_21675 [Oesophagostomum dentatum]|uniref:Oxidoreductase, short chain dehydrogenase/reductase family protein n=1 Tax=Oesophagostomum dentatum TaxID=61180 RepID=A0A0B1S5E0_OESDE|nr:hypothetical protein OESDEN_21675 [Oesophagostomum dentatum]